MKQRSIRARPKYILYVACRDAFKEVLKIHRKRVGSTYVLQRHQSAVQVSLELVAGACVIAGTRNAQRPARPKGPGLTARQQLALEPRL